MAGIYRTRPGADAIAPAVEGPAVEIGNRLWMSKGVSNSYAIDTDEGRVIINAGLPFEGHIRKRAFDAVCPGPTAALVFTQGHADHFAGYRPLLDDNTDIIMQENWRLWKTEHELLPSYRPRNTGFAFAHLAEAMIAGFADLPEDERQVSFPEPTVEFREQFELNIGGREIVLFSTPGGETTDALIVWVPDERTVFTGNLFGPLFGHVPNLVTIRGDRYREAPQYVDSANTVLSLGAERLVTGHFEPIEGADLIAEEVTNLRDSTQWVYDRVIEGMEAGEDGYTLMREVQIPAHFGIGEGYGKTSWNVRAIWETHSGWFHHRSTTELYGVPVDAVAADIVSAAGPQALVAAAQARVDAGEFVEAIHLTDMVLAAHPDYTAAREVGATAHDRLLAQTDNFWEQSWLRHRSRQLKG